MALPWALLFTHFGRANPVTSAGAASPAQASGKRAYGHRIYQKRPKLWVGFDVAMMWLVGAYGFSNNRKKSFPQLSTSQYRG